jgi:hypothetical protein
MSQKSHENVNWNKKKGSQLSDGIHPQWQSDSVLLSKLKASTNFQN